MKLKVLITAALLVMAGPVTADGTVVQKAYEVAVSDLRLPRVEAGTIAFKECDKCKYVRIRVGADTTYRVNGNPVPLDKFRGVLAEVADRENEAVTVLHHLKRNQVTDVSVSL